jgi:hyperosmotically inducible protein
MFGKVAVLIAMVLVSSAPARAGDRENLQLYREVQREVLQYPHFTIFDSVHIGVDKGRVTLTGKVTMPFKRTEIERRVAALPSVTNVDNRIEELPVSQSDNELRYLIARAIYGNQNFRAYASRVNPPIHIIVERGRVTLEGVVLSNVDRMLARSIASSFLSFSVTNDLQTEAEARDALEKL